MTQPPKRRKRRGKEIPSPVGLMAEELNIPVLCPEKVSFVRFDQNLNSMLCYATYLHLYHFYSDFLFLFWKASDTNFLDKLEQEIQPDICITAAYGQYLPKRFLAIPSFGEYVVK